MTGQSSNGPCTGVKVLELATSMVSGPFCGQMLGDLGAEVIKLESLGGDVMRTVYPLKDGHSGQFLQFNRNKQSIAVDLKAPEGRAIAIDLIRQADVLIENFRPGVTARMGLDYDSARAINPRLIYVSINGFGPDGPYAKLPAYDQVIQGLSGFMSIQGDAEQPAAIRSVAVDKTTSLSACAATLAALYGRERSGEGQHVQVSMLDAFAAMMLPEFIAAHAFEGSKPAPLPSPGIYRTLRTADGHLVGLIVQDSQFAAICRALGRPELIDDERYSSPAKRFPVMAELLGLLEEATLSKTTAELLDLLWQDADVAIAPVNGIGDFLVDPQVAHNRTVFTMEDPAIGPVRQLAPFARLAGCDIDRFRRAPGLGEHSDSILNGLGLPVDRIAELRERGVIR